MFGDGAFADRPFGSIGDSGAGAIISCLATLTASFSYVLYVGTSQYATAPNDTLLANQPFKGRLEQPLKFTRSIVGTDIGSYTVGDGVCIIKNDDGFYDFLPQTYAIDGRDIEIKVGRKGDDSSLWFTIFKGTANSWALPEDSVQIVLRDYSYKLAVPAQGNLYGGTGGADGGADLAQKRKPRAFGYVFNVQPPLLDSSTLTYQVNDGPVNAIPAVYDRGASLTAGADYASYAALVAATISAGSFATCLALGYFRLNSNPAGTVTADVQGDASGGSFVTTTADIVRRLTATGGLRDPSDLATASFSTLNAVQGAPVGMWLSTDDTSAVADVIASLMKGVGGWGGFRRNGLFEVQRFVAPGSSVANFLRSDIFDIKREPLPSALVPVPWRWRVAYDKCWTVQTDLAGSVSATRKAFVALSDRLAVASSSQVQVDHPAAQDPAPVASFFRDLADAQAEASRLLALYQVERSFYRLTLPRRALLLNLGDTINVTYPRWDLIAGRNLVAVEITENLTAPRPGSIDTVEVLAYG